MWLGLDLLERKFWRNGLNQKVRDEEVKWKGGFVSLVVDAWASHKHEIFASKLSSSSIFNTSVFWCVCVFVGVFWFEFCHIVCKSSFLLKFLSSSYAYQTQVNFYYCIQINISLENFHSSSYLHQTQLNFCYILFIQINIYLGSFHSSSYAYQSQLIFWPRSSSYDQNWL
jgi:hypothetical protein